MSEDQMVAILAHELGHYYHGHAYAPMGRYGFLFHLNDVNDPTELMNPTTTGILGLGPGDRAGLALVGAVACEP